MKRTKGIGPKEAISEAIAAMSSGCPIVTSNLLQFFKMEQVTPRADGVSPAFLSESCRVA
jgi:hypothetical protein